MVGLFFHRITFCLPLSFGHVHCNVPRIQNYCYCCFHSFHLLACIFTSSFNTHTLIILSIPYCILCCCCLTVLLPIFFPPLCFALFIFLHIFLSFYFSHCRCLCTTVNPYNFNEQSKKHNKKNQRNLADVVAITTEHKKPTRKNAIRKQNPPSERLSDLVCISISGSFDMKRKLIPATARHTREKKT